MLITLIEVYKINIQHVEIVLDLICVGILESTTSCYVHVINCLCAILPFFVNGATIKVYQHDKKLHLQDSAHKLNH
jgi:hypothetical protein